MSASSHPVGRLEQPRASSKQQANASSGAYCLLATVYCLLLPNASLLSCWCSMCKSFLSLSIISRILLRSHPIDALLPPTSTTISFSQRRMAASLTSVWGAGTEILSLAPSDLSKLSSTGPQLAKDVDYAKAILKAWTSEAEERTAKQTSACSNILYKCNNKDETSLHGCLYRRSQLIENNVSAIPGLILFHTGAGPQDMFLRWKADSLVNDEELFPNGCVVLIADIIGDGEGWAWTDRSRYETVRKSILIADEEGERNELRCRIQAAIHTLSAQPGVDPGQIAALGFCMGGHPILELARMNVPSVKVLITYHGVFDGVDRLSHVSNSDNKSSRPNVLVCTGEDDPFVGKEDLALATAMFNDIGCNCRVMKFEKTRHGFTNPAQDYNPSDAFAFNEDSYSKSWTATRDLLKKAFQLNK